jgi:hypothetical protein
MTQLVSFTAKVIIVSLMLVMGTVAAQAKDCLFLEIHYYPYVYLLGGTARAAGESFRALTRQGQRRRFGCLRGPNQ